MPEDQVKEATEKALNAATADVTSVDAPTDSTIPPIDVTAQPEMPTSEDAAPSIMAEVANKIAGAYNILVALSSDPSVDEMAAAIGLTIYLDRIGKKTTAIYSGATPNALEFLNPEETFESTADVLQDFVIALNKDKADHLRYKLDGDFVKIYITPYESKISEEDLEYSYGDFNVDLVLALDVANGIDLDEALREHGRIMHDATVINITTSKPGKFGEIEWSEIAASSVSEMIAKLLYAMSSKSPIEKEEATAFLTGIVAATNRFSNAKTSPDTMKISSRLMESGANQQLVAKNITPDVDNELFMFNTVVGASKKEDSDPTNLSIEHEGDGPNNSGKEIEGTVTEKASTLLDDLKLAEASLANAGAEAVPEAQKQPLNLNQSKTMDQPTATEPISEPETPTEPAEATKPAEIIEPSQEAQSENAPDSSELSDNSPESPSTSSISNLDEGLTNRPEKVIQPENADFSMLDAAEDANKYSKMLEDALNEDGENPAAAVAPSISSSPEVSSVPEMDYSPMPSDEILPPPPAPPIMEGMPPVSDVPATIPSPAPSEPTLSQPAMQDQVYNAPANNPGSFKIPGM